MADTACVLADVLLNSFQLFLGGAIFAVFLTLVDDIPPGDLDINIAPVNELPVGQSPMRAHVACTLALFNIEHVENFKQYRYG